MDRWGKRWKCHGLHDTPPHPWTQKWTLNTPLNTKVQLDLKKLEICLRFCRLNNKEIYGLLLLLLPMAAGGLFSTLSGDPWGSIFLVSSPPWTTREGREQTIHSCSSLFSALWWSMWEPLLSEMLSVIEVYLFYSETSQTTAQCLMGHLWSHWCLTFQEAPSGLRAVLNNSVKKTNHQGQMTEQWKGAKKSVTFAFGSVWKYPD